MNERKHLTQTEVERLIAATKNSRNEARDRALLLLMFRHGLRVSEACAMRLSQVDVESRVLHVARLKKGLSTTHPLRADELRAIKAWTPRPIRPGLKSCGADGHGLSGLQDQQLADDLMVGVLHRPRHRTRSSPSPAALIATR